MKLFMCAGLSLLLLGFGFVLVESHGEPPSKSGKTLTGKGGKKMVRIHVFNKEGKLVGPFESPKFVLSNEEWHKRLTPEQFKILRKQDTEAAFCGTLLDNKLEGVYTCVGCGLPLFSSDAKFHSGTGWPSFFRPISPLNVLERKDISHGMVRTEIMCARCDGHLGHVFDDGPQPTGQRHCLNSASLTFTASDKLASLADPLADSADVKKEQEATREKTSAKPIATATETEVAVFAGGCFWCTEAAFEQLNGVSDVQSGYAGGAEKTATYDRVSTGRTGHAEAIRVTYDPQRIGYDKLLDVFFDGHDPTTLNRQGPDVGTQYRSAIFYANDEQKRVAVAKIKELTDRKVFPHKIVTTLEPLKGFYPAEDYHQDYAKNNPLQPYVQAHSLPKACKIRDKHPDLIKPSEAKNP